MTDAPAAGKTDMRRRTSHTQADIKRALKVAASIGAREVSIEPSAIRIILGDGVISGEKSSPRLVKKPRSII